MRKLCIAIVVMCSTMAHAAYDLAVNIDGIADWMSSRAFIDATAYFRRWGMPNAGWQENPNLKLNADNYPLSDADAVTHLRAYPQGVYKLRYEGSADVSFTGGAKVVAGTIKKTAGITTADVLLTQPGELTSIAVRNVDAKDPLRNLQLLTPGYPDAKQVFTNEFLKRVRPFPTIRFMDWQQTNANTTKEWSERATPAQFGRTSAKGVPVEEIVALANATGRNVWVNLPLMASDDYIKQFATYLKDNLHANAVIHVEYSNEVWNFGFQQAKDNLAAAKANTNLTKPDDFGRCAQNAADKLGKSARIFKSVFGDERFNAKVRMCVGGFIAVSYWGQVQLDWIKDKHPGLIKEIAIAPYFGVEGDIKDADAQGASADALFDKLNTLIDKQITPWIQQHDKLAKAHGLALVAYEGGNHLTATNNMNEETKKKMQADPRIAKTYKHLLDVWQANGGGAFTQFGHIGPYTKFGSWGLLENMTDPGSVKWDFFMSQLLPAGDADLDGKVTMADFAILKINMNQSGKWWKQGDFNGDGKVDDADVKLLLNNAQGLTEADKKLIGELAK